MNIKKICTKIIASALSIITLGSTLPAMAMFSGTPTEYEMRSAAEIGARKARFLREVDFTAIPSKKAQKRMINEQISRLNHILGGRLEISADVREEIHPYVLYVFIKKICDVFEAYPGITSLFIRQLDTLTTEHKLFINTQICGQEEVSTAITTPIKVGHAGPVIKISKNVFGKRPTRLRTYFGDDVIKNIAFYKYCAVDARHACCPSKKLEDLIGSTMIHEMGHLFQKTLALCRMINSDEYVRNHIPFCMATFPIMIKDLSEHPGIASTTPEATMKINEAVAGMPEFGNNPILIGKALSRCAGILLRLDAFKTEYKKINEEFKKYCQIPLRAGDAVSNYARTGASDFFAETFVDALLGREIGTATILGEALIQYLKFIDSCLSLGVD